MGKQLGFAPGVLEKSVGEVNKSYPGGTNITEAIVFGRIAGENAAKATPLVD